jgi:30S ribosomal protein S31
MGKGDRKTAKGKRNISSYGKARPNVGTGAAAKSAAVTKTTTGAAKAPVAKKAPAKKVAAK